MGTTSLSQSDFHEYLTGISNRFTSETYSLLKNNCNNFTSECAQFLTGKDIPKWITGLPEEALNTPMGQPIRQMIEQQEMAMRQSMSVNLQGGNEYLNLPPLGRGQSSGSSNLKQNNQIPKNEEKKDEVKEEIPHIEKKEETPSNKVMKNPWQKKQVVSTNPQHPQHPHESLKYLVLQSDNSPLLSKDTKFKSFYALIKVASNKLKKKDSSIALAQDEVSLLKKAVDTCSQGLSDKIAKETFILFDRLLNDWPTSSMFGVLGLLRLFILRPEGNEYYGSKDISSFDPVIKIVPDTQDIEDGENKESTPAPIAVQVMALRTMLNTFASSSIASKIGREPKVVNMAMSALRSKNQKIRLMGASLLYNCSLYMPKDDSDSVVESVSLLAELIPEETDFESCYRCLLALSQLVYTNTSAALIVSELSLHSSIGKNINTDKTKEKLNAVYKDIQKILNFEEEEIVD